jgi:hypothetical protein
VRRGTLRRPEQDFRYQLESLKSSATSATDEWKHKLKADADALKATIDRQKQLVDAKFKAQYADDLEDDAYYAVDYAVASIKDAEAAVLAAITARKEADEASSG